MTYRLTDEEILKIARDYAPTDYCQLALDVGALVAEAQLQKLIDSGDVFVREFVSSPDWVGTPNSSGKWCHMIPLSEVLKEKE